MTKVNIHEAKTHLSRLLERVEQGEEVVIARAGKPVAKLVKIEAAKNRQFGRAKGMVRFLPGWNDPITEEGLIGK